MPQFEWTSITISCSLNLKSHLGFQSKNSSEVCEAHPLHPTQRESRGPHPFRIQVDCALDTVLGSMLQGKKRRLLEAEGLRAGEWAGSDPNCCLASAESCALSQSLHCLRSYCRVEVHSLKPGDQTLIVHLARNCRSLCRLFGNMDIYLFGSVSLPPQ